MKTNNLLNSSYSLSTLVTQPSANQLSVMTSSSTLLPHQSPWRVLRVIWVYWPWCVVPCLTFNGRSRKRFLRITRYWYATRWLAHRHSRWWACQPLARKSVSRPWTSTSSRTVRLFVSTAFQICSRFWYNLVLSQFQDNNADVVDKEMYCQMLILAIHFYQKSDNINRNQSD